GTFVYSRFEYTGFLPAAVRYPMTFRRELGDERIYRIDRHSIICCRVWYCILGQGVVARPEDQGRGGSGGDGDQGRRTPGRDHRKGSQDRSKGYAFQNEKRFRRRDQG